ncbi:MAG: hypothetical protein MASP_01921 [Candidatus Methanolliviera sp. GoM_asphalt]|nr:MAG: hypothetical protein MASP_01921 [Candidatus Methanolliviera sp. GoM_asphalt]
MERVKVSKKDEGVYEPYKMGLRSDKARAKPLNHTPYSQYPPPLFCPTTLEFPIPSTSCHKGWMMKIKR